LQSNKYGIKHGKSQQAHYEITICGCCGFLCNLKYRLEMCTEVAVVVIL